MIIKLLSNQIPSIWDSIKYAATNVDRISEHDKPFYLNRLLTALLNDKAQCFVRLDESRQLLAIAITRITQDEITGEKSLFLNCLYSFKGVGTDQWKTDFDSMKLFAKANHCKKVVTYSNNERVFEIASSLGFGERYRCFSLDLEV